MELKRGKDDVQKAFSTQLKPAMKESDVPYVVGFLYDKERLYIFHKRDGKIVRYDETKNKISGTSLDFSPGDTDSYLSVPSFDEIVAKVSKPASIDRTKRSVDELEIITGRSSVQVKDALSNILKALEQYRLEGDPAYSIFIQTLALKIFDERRNQKEGIPLRFYVTEKEMQFKHISDSEAQNFIERLELIRQEAEEKFKLILQDNRINWKKESHVRAVQTIVQNFQDFSLAKSSHTDLYELVFYNFAHEFQKIEQAQFLTPIPIIEFLVKIVNPRGGDSVCDPCVGIGNFLSLSFVFSDPKNGGQRQLSDENLWGVDISDNMITLAQLNMLLNGDGNCHLLSANPDFGSILQKINKTTGQLVPLNPTLHKYDEKKGVADWDKWLDETKLKKFNVVLTNPPFGRGRSFEIKNDSDRAIMEMYETWWKKSSPNSLDKGIIFLENAYHILDTNGRMGIVLSNAIASEDQNKAVMKWLMEKMRIVAIFDLPPGVFAETDVNTTIIVAYKPKKDVLEKLKQQKYTVFPKNIKNIGYEKKTKDRNVVFEDQFQIDPTTFEYIIDDDGKRVLEEDFTVVVKEFREWARSQEEDLQKAFIL